MQNLIKTVMVRDRDGFFHPTIDVSKPGKKCAKQLRPAVRSALINNGIVVLLKVSGSYQ